MSRASAGFVWYRNFTNGLWLQSSLGAPREGTVAAILNMLPLPDGGAVTRNGMGAVYAHSGTNTFAQGNQPITGCFQTTTSLPLVAAGPSAANSTTTVIRPTTGVTSFTATNGPWAVDSCVTPDGNLTCLRLALDARFGTPGPSYRIDGNGTATALTACGAGQWQETYGTSGMHAPRAAVCAYWRGYAWVGNTVVDSARGYFRVRWSHPGFPFRWRSKDYVDVGVSSLDAITALAPFGDVLVVFTQRNIYGIYGYSPETFSVTTIANGMGTYGPQSVVVDDKGVWFVDNVTRSVCHWGGSGAPKVVSHGIEDAFGYVIGSNLWDGDSYYNQPRIGSLQGYVHVTNVIPSYTAYQWQFLNEGLRPVLTLDTDTGAWTAHSLFRKSISDEYDSMRIWFYDYKTMPSNEVFGWFYNWDQTTQSFWCLINEGLPGLEMQDGIPRATDVADVNNWAKIRTSLKLHLDDFGDLSTFKIARFPFVYGSRLYARSPDVGSNQINIWVRPWRHDETPTPVKGYTFDETPENGRLGEPNSLARPTLQAFPYQVIGKFNALSMEFTSYGGCWHLHSMGVEVQGREGERT